MKRFRAFLFLAFCLSLPGPSAIAEMVHYIDEQGKMHFINTETSHIPEKYRSQIADQIPAISQGREAMEAAAEARRQAKLLAPTTPVANPRNSVPTGKAKAPLVEVFVGMDCPECDRWESTLRKNRVPYARYDVKYHPHGQEVYSKMSSPLPFTMIGNEMIQGEDIERLLSLLKSPQKTTEPKSEERGTP